MSIILRQIKSAFHYNSFFQSNSLAYIILGILAILFIINFEKPLSAYPFCTSERDMPDEADIVYRHILVYRENVVILPLGGLCSAAEGKSLLLCILQKRCPITLFAR